MRVKCLAQGHNTLTRSGLESGPYDPESSVLTTRPPRLSCEGKNLAASIEEPFKLLGSRSQMIVRSLRY